MGTPDIAPSLLTKPAVFSARCPLVLASSSPRRIAFLAKLGLHARTLCPPSQCEPQPLPGERPETYALRAASAKARGSLALLSSDNTPSNTNAPSPLLIAADTIVVLQRRILGKPRDPEHALSMLRALAGKTHTVITACSLWKDGREECFAVRSKVRMWDCPEELLAAYARSGEPADKAGAYAVQGAGAFLVKSIEGSWSNVVGLPLAELVQALLALRAIAPTS